MGKSLVGFDKDGKLNPEKALRNAAITALAAGATLIPVLGPAIGYGLLAYGVGSGVVLAKTDIQPCTNSSAPITLPPQGCTNLINAPIPKAPLAKKTFGECPCGWWPQEAISYALNLEPRATVKFEHKRENI